MKRPKILGIVNITEDSFSDGGRYLNIDKAIEHALELHKYGADIIDLGAASSNPASKVVSTEEEIKRLEPVIEKLHSEQIALSVDTFNPEVQQFCISKEIAFLNDIQGFPFENIYPDLAKSNCKLIVMHSIQRIGTATVEDRNPEEVLNSMFDFFKERINALEEAGVAHERIILDPGMGFFLGSNPECSILALKNIKQIKETFGLPVLIGVSRKSFLGSLTGENTDNRGAATLAAEIFAYYNEVDYIRTHDVKTLHDALNVLERLKD